MANPPVLPSPGMRTRVKDARTGNENKPPILKRGTGRGGGKVGMTQSGVRQQLLSPGLDSNQRSGSSPRTDPWGYRQTKRGAGRPAEACQETAVAEPYEAMMEALRAVSVSEGSSVDGLEMATGEDAASSSSQPHWQSLEATISSPPVRLSENGPWGYPIEVNCAGVSFPLLKRYSEFRFMHTQLTPPTSAALPAFPPDRWFETQDEAFASRRAAELAAYLTELSQLPAIHADRGFHSFLELGPLAVLAPSAPPTPTPGSI
uniref:PX domain-containing protein n=1 Tax=Haptolina ericina TaxID=156174 RepID=A0A7S3AG26_9EUKA